MARKVVAVGGHEIDDEAGRLIAPCLEHERLIHEERPVHIDDDARLARREQPVAVAGDEAPLLGAETLGHLEADLREIDDDAIGIGEREDVDLDLLRQVGDEPGAGPVASQSRILGDRLALARIGVSSRQAKSCGQNRTQDRAGGDRPQQGTETSHLPSPAPFSTLRRGNHFRPRTAPGPTRFEPEIPYGYQNLKACWLSEACDPLGAN